MTDLIVFCLLELAIFSAGVWIGFTHCGHRGGEHP